MVDEEKVLVDYVDLPEEVRAQSSRREEAACLIDAALADCSAVFSRLLAAQRYYNAEILDERALLFEHFDLDRDLTYAVTSAGLIEVEIQDQQQTRGVPDSLIHSMALMDEETINRIVDAAPPNLKGRLVEVRDKLNKLKEEDRNEDPEDFTG